MRPGSLFSPGELLAALLKWHRRCSCWWRGDGSSEHPFVARRTRPLRTAVKQAHGATSARATPCLQGPPHVCQGRLEISGFVQRSLPMVWAMHSLHILNRANHNINPPLTGCVCWNFGWIFPCLISACPHKGCAGTQGEEWPNPALLHAHIRGCMRPVSRGTLTQVSCQLLHEAGQKSLVLGCKVAPPASEVEKQPHFSRVQRGKTNT